MFRLLFPVAFIVGDVVLLNQEGKMELGEYRRLVQKAQRMVEWYKYKWNPATKRYGFIDQQPCELCGKENTEAHHRDYRKPLEVTWLCRAHHAAEHSGKSKKYQWLGPDSNDPKRNPVLVT